jgi:hypothetical protein
MMFERVADLPVSEYRAVIINVSTKTVATLALASALRHAQMPVVLIDCESTDGSLAHFTRLMERMDFDLVSAPLRPHGQTLDRVLGQIPSDKVLLVDSDLEILDDRIVSFFREFIDDEQTFGCGFVNGPGWLTDHVGTSLEGAYYHERMWMPITLLDVPIVREALAAGYSFDADTTYNRIGASARASHLIEAVRRRIGPLAPVIDRLVPRWLRNSYYGHRPAVVFRDTGADVYQYLRYERELLFVGLPEWFHPRYVTHFFGTTRSSMGEVDVHGGDRHHDNLQVARERLASLYGLEAP